jgi:hypothetical protein
MTVLEDTGAEVVGVDVAGAAAVDDTDGASVTAATVVVRSGSVEAVLDAPPPSSASPQAAAPTATTATAGNTQPPNS